MSAPLISGGGYDRYIRMCSVAYKQHFKNREPDDTHEDYNDWYVASLAGTIVHEATHGRLFSLGIPYNATTRVRVERLCSSRERRFISRLHSDHFDLMLLVPAFDPAEWEPYWNLRSRFSKCRAAIRRALGDLRDG